MTDNPVLDSSWIAQKVKAVRDELSAAMGRRHATATSLAESAGMSPDGILRRLSGETKLTVDDLVKLATALDHEVTIELRPRANV